MESTHDAPRPTARAAAPSLHRTQVLGRRGTSADRLAVRLDDCEVASAQVRRSGPSELEITDLRVTPEFRGLEIGKALIRAAAGLAAEQGARFLALSSQDSGSGRLDAWYRRLGFFEIGVSQPRLKRFRAPVGMLLTRLC